MITFERAGQDSPVGWRSLVGVLLVPLIVALGFLGATWGADHRLHRAEAAVVNLDEMVELNGQPVPLGRQLAAGLVERRDDNLTWVLADADHAAAGLKSGRYVAVVTIPREFSADATSFSGPAAEARQATLGVETSQVTGVADGAIAQVIADTAKSVFNTELTETYLDNVYLGFNESKEQFRTVADAADKLADGGDQLATGMRSSADGAQELATGSRSYATGVGKAATGADQLATGAEQLAGGGGQLKTGANGLASGADQLADGLGTMATQTRDLPAQTRQLADGAGQLAGGVGQLADGLGQLGAGSQALANGSQQFTDGTAQLAPGVRAYVGGVDQLVAGMEPILKVLDGVDTSQLDAARLQAAADRLGAVQAEARVYAGELEEIAAAGCPTPQGVEFTAAQRAAFCAEWDRAMGRLTTASPQTGGRSPIEWTQDLAGSTDFADAITTTRTMLPQLPQIIEGAKQIRQLRPAGQQIVTGVDGVAAGAARLNTGVQALNAGVGQAAGGVPQLAAGADQLATGADRLADGMVPLSAGIQSAAGGSRQLADGAGELATGVGQYVDGVDQVATGTRSLATGLGGLATGAGDLATGTQDLADGLDRAAQGGRELADGQRELADGLAEGATKIPTYSDADRAALKTAVAQPVARGEVPELIPAASSTSLLQVLALWLGALATYVVMRAVSTRVLTSTRSSAALVARSLLPGLAIVGVQAVALTVLGQVVLGLSAAKVLGVLAMLLLGAAMFTVVNHALVAWFGGLGRVVSVAMVTLTAAGGLLSAVPMAFDLLTPLLPLTPVLHGVRAIITDGSGVPAAVGATLLWLVIGLVASVGAVLRRRTVSPEPFARLLAPPAVG